MGLDQKNGMETHEEDVTDLCRDQTSQRKHGDGGACIQGASWGIWMHDSSVHPWMSLLGLNPEKELGSAVLNFGGGGGGGGETQSA